MAYQTINPFNGETLKTYPTITDVDFKAKLDAAAACYETWRHKSYKDSAKIIAKAAELMRTQVEKFAKAMTLDMGKRIN